MTANHRNVSHLIRLALSALRTALAVTLLGLGPAVQAADVDMPTLVQRYGKKAVMEVLMEARSGQITVRVPGAGVKDAWGRPRLDLVDAGTLETDAGKAGMSLDALQAALSEHTAEQEERERRLSAASATPNSAVPLANIDPKHSIRPHRQRRWTVAQLIKDANIEKPHWPEELNRLRQQQAAIRNRRIEDILVSWTARYGTMDVDEIARGFERRTRAPVDECRRLKRKRKTRPEYKMRGCDQIIKDASVDRRRTLREQLARPFLDFEAKMRPALKAYARGHSAGSLY